MFVDTAANWRSKVEASKI